MIRTAILVAAKDLRIEVRSRVLLWQVVPFGVMALLLIGLAVGPSATTTRHVAPGLFYVVLVLVTLLMINRSQAVENSPGTKTSVTMLGLDQAGVFLGKALALLLELAMTSVVLLAGVVLFLHVPLHGALVASPSALLTIATMSVAGTLYGAIASGVDGPATLLPVLALPAFAPLLIAGERSFASAFSGGALAKWLLILILALIVYVAIGIILYGALEES